MFGDNKKSKGVIYIGADHAGFERKSKLRDFLISEGYDVTDLGSFTEDPYDYPDIAREVSEKVLERKGSKGVLLCGTGIGVAMSANKLHGIRAVNAGNEAMAEMSRVHNDANVLTMGARVLSEEDMQKIALKFLTTDFDDSEERHVRRVKKIDMQ